MAATHQTIAITVSGLAELAHSEYQVGGVLVVVLMLVLVVVRFEVIVVGVTSCALVKSPRQRNVFCSNSVFTLILDILFFLDFGGNRDFQYSIFADSILQAGDYENAEKHSMQLWRQVSFSFLGNLFLCSQVILYFYLISYKSYHLSLCFTNLFVF